MNVLPLVRSQLVPPRIKQVLKRKRLYDLGLNIVSHRVTTVTAPAGYGKSVFISSLLEEPGWPLTAWLSLDHHDMEPSHLLYHLIYAIKTLLPDFGLMSLRTVGSLESAVLNWPIAVNTFIEELPQEQDLVLVLDDVHLIHENTVSCAIIEYLLRWLPANTHLVLISRTTLRLNLYHQELSGGLWEIKTEQLLFSEEETQEMLALLDVELNAAELASICNYTEGWAVALRLVGIMIKASGGNPEKAWQALKRDGSTLNQYLNNELMTSLPDQLQNFLLDSSLLPYLGADLCNTALQCQDSALKLEQLEAYGLLSRMESADLTWRMHHLFKEYLEDKVSKLLSPEYIASIRKRAGVFFEKYGEIDRAIEQAMASTDWDLAASLIQCYGYDYFTVTGRLDALYRWIKQLPQEQVTENQWLLYFKAKSILHINDDEALTLLVSASDLASSKGDAKCEACCLLAISSALTFSGDMQKAGEVERRLAAHPALLEDPGARGTTLAILLAQALFRDDLRQGIKLSRQALRLELNPETRMLVLYASAIIYERQGNLSYAQQLVEEALAMPFVQENERWAVTGYIVLTQILNLIGDRAALEEYCHKTIHLSQKYGMMSQLGRAYRQLGRMYLREGRYIEAHQAMELAYNYSVENDSASMDKLVAMELMRLRLKTGENAKALLAETHDLLSGLKAIPVGQGGDNYSLGLAAIVAMEAGELDLAQQWLDEAAAIWRKIGAKQNLAGTHLLLAHVYLLQGDERNADIFLRKALSLAETGKWINFWEWHEETIYTMCRRALARNIHASWALQLLVRWFPHCTTQELGRFLISPDDKTRSLVSANFIKYFQDTGTTTIHVFYLNGFHVFVNGAEVRQKDWKTHKAENLFKFLAANRRHHSKEEIIEQLWPGSDLSSGDASLRMALSHVRKAIGVSQDGQGWVSLQRGKLGFSAGVNIYTDYEFFVSEAQKAMQYLEAGSPYAINALEEAVQLYRGSFLPEDSYADWINNVRFQLHSLYLQLLLKLAQVHFEQNNPAKAWDFCRQYLLYEPADEQVARLAIQALCLNGQKHKALSIYKQLLVTLSNEYDIAPEAETIALYKYIKEQGAG